MRQFECANQNLVDHAAKLGVICGLGRSTSNGSFKTATRKATLIFATETQRAQREHSAASSVPPLCPLCLCGEAQITLHSIPRAARSLARLHALVWRAEASSVQLSGTYVNQTREPRAPVLYRFI